MTSEMVREMLSGMIEQRKVSTHLRVFVAKEIVAQFPGLNELLLEAWRQWDKADALSKSVSRITSHPVEKSQKGLFSNISHLEYWSEAGGLLHAPERDAPEMTFFQDLIQKLKEKN